MEVTCWDTRKSALLRRRKHVSGDLLKLSEHLRDIAREWNVTDVAEIPMKEGNWTIEEAFPEVTWNKSGIAIRGYRYREGLNQKQLSEITGIPQRHISEMGGKRAVGKERVKKLAKALNADYRSFL